MWQGVAQAAAPFMQEQRSPNHFEFFGIDVIADANGECWLIEINRVPGLESSNNRCKPQEDALFDEMMSSLLDMVLAPLQLRGDNVDEGNTKDEKNTIKDEKMHPREIETSETETVFSMDTLSQNKQSYQHQYGQERSPCHAVAGWWQQVSEANPASQGHTSSSAVFKNLFNWKAFTSKNKSKLFV